MVFHIRTILFYTIFRQRLRGPRISKRFALVLAFACAFTMFAGAAFTDQSDIAVDADVVDTMSSLGVIEGYLDGSFRPDDTVTRGEMAKMIYVVRTGRSDASAYNDDATTFTDIGDHWARGYIKYCNSLGIIAGHSATRFAPDDTVTTQEAAKMLLVTLGYNAETAGLVGAGWGTKTNALADENGLLEDVVNGTTQALPRQYAAQLIYNAIFTPTVRLRDGEYTNMNDDGDYYPTIGERYMDLQSYETVLDYYRDGKAYFTSYPSGVSFNDYTADHSDLIDREVRVLYKTATTINGKATIYGLFELGDNTYIDTIVGDVTDYSAADKEIDINGTTYDVAADEDFDSSVNWAQDNYSAQPVTVTVNDQNEVYKLEADSNFKVAQVTYVGSKTINATDGFSEAVEDIDAYDDIAKDDWVVVSYNDYTEKYVLTKADVVTGELEVVNGSDITIDGEVYTVADDARTSAEDMKKDLVLGESVEVVVVDGYIYSAEKVSGIASLEDVLYVNGMERSTSYGDTTYTAQAIFTDGTSEPVEVADITGDDGWQNEIEVDGTADEVKKAAHSKDGLYVFDLDDGEYTLRPVNHDDIEDFEDEDLNITSAGDDRIGNFRVNDEAVVFVKDSDGDVHVLSGADVKAWGKDNVGVTAGKAYGDKSNGFTYVDLAELTITDDDVPGSSYDETYGYVVNTLGQTKEDNTTYTSFSVWTGSEAETIRVKGDANDFADIVKGTFVKIDGDELIKLNTSDDVFSRVTGKVGDDILCFDGSNTEYKITEDTQIIYVSVADEEGSEGGSIELATDVTEEHAGDEANVLFGASPDGNDWELDYIFVDVNNDILNKLGN